MSVFKKAPGPRKEVMFLNPDDHRFIDIPVDRETESLVYCKKHQGILYRFFKLGPAWTGKVIRFLGVEGYPLISYISGEDENGDSLYAACSVKEFLELVWGKSAYTRLPDKLKTLVENPAVGAIVNVKPFIPDKETQQVFDKVKAESVLYDADLDNLAHMGESREVKKWGDRIMDKLPWICTGAFSILLLQGLGVLK